MFDDTTPPLIRKVQNTLFDVFDLVLENRKLSVGLANFLIAMHYLQMISMLFNASNPDLEETLIQNYLFLGDYFLIFLGLSKSPNFAISLFVTILITLLILVLILGFFYIHFFKDPDDIFQKDFSNLLAFLYDCLDRVFLIPCFGVLILNMTCVSYSCGSLEHIILIIWSITLIIIIIFLEFLYVFCFFNFTFRIMDGFSRNPSQRPFLSFLIKILLITFSVVMDINSNYFILVSSHTIYGWFLFQETLTNYPYHDKNVSKCYGIFVSGYFWINASLVFVRLVGSISSFFKENTLVIIFLGAVLFVKLFLTLRNYTIKELMISELDEIKSDIHLDLKVRLFNDLSQTIHIKKHELLLASLLKIHSDKCEDIDCICRRRNELYDPFLNIYGDQNLQFHKDDVFVKHYLIKMIKEGIAKFSDSKLLYLDFIFYNFEALKIYAPIYCFIKYFQQKYPNNLHLSFQFCIHRLLAQLERFLIKKNHQAGLNECLMIDNVKKFDKGIINLRVRLTQCLDDYMQIWNNLNQNMPDLGVLLKTCNHCIENNNELLKQYEILVGLNDQSQKLKNYMEIYCLYISYDELLWARVEKDIRMPLHMEIGDSLHQELEYLLHKYNMFDDNVGTVVISPNFENMGQILWVSCNIPKIFHYDVNQFKTMNVSNLMPDVIGKTHEKILQTFYLTSKEIAINNFRHVWALNKEGFCFSVNILVKIIPMKDDFEIMGLIHRLNEGDYLLTSNEGDLLNIGKKLSEIMEMPPELLIQMKINLQLLAPRLTQYYKKVFVEDNDLPDTTNLILKSDQLKDNIQRKSLASVKTTKKNANKNKDNFVERNKQIRFYIFIPENLEGLLKFQQEETQKTEAKFDLQKIKERIFKDVKMLVQLRKCFGSSLKKTFNQIDLKTVKKVLRVKASLQHVRYCNGDINFVAIKILFLEIKKPDLISFEKRQQQAKYIKHFLKDMNKIEENINIINSNQKVLEEQENRDDNADNDANQMKTVEKSSNDRIKGMLNLFRKKSPNVFLAPTKEKSKVENEGNISRQSSNLNSSERAGRKKFLEDQITPESSKRTPPIKTNALKNMLIRMKKNDSKKKPSKIEEDEEEEKEEPTVKPFANLLKKLPKKTPPEDTTNLNEGPSIDRDIKKKLTSLEPIQPSINLLNINSSNQNLLVNKNNDLSINTGQKKLPYFTNFTNSNQKLSFKNTLSSNEKKPPPFGSQSSFQNDAKSKSKNPLSILSQIEENVKFKDKALILEKESSPENPKPKSWTSKFRNILIKKGIFEKNPAAKTKAPIKKAGFSPNKGLTGIGLGGGEGGGFSGLRSLLNKAKSKAIATDDSGTSPSAKSELLKENGSDFSSNSDERSAELNLLLKSENSTKHKEVERQDLKEKMEKMWVLEDREQVNSIASSAFSSVAQNSMKKIRENLKKQKTALGLKISNILAFICCIVISALTLSQNLYAKSQIDQMFKILQEANSIAFYNENFLKIYNYYEVRRMTSLGYYDWGSSWETIEQDEIKKALEIMISMSNNDIVQDIATQGSDSQQNEYVFLTYQVDLKIKGTGTIIQMNFLDFFRLFIVSINATLGLNSTKDFKESSIAGNDYLSFIFDNFGIIEKIIDSNNQFIHKMLVDSSFVMKMRIIFIWVFTFIILIISFAVVFPIIYQSKSKIFNTLALFTKIPLTDVEYYNNHYKQIMLNLGRIEEESELLKTIQSQFEQNQKDLITLKRADVNSFIRTRNYKGININKFSFISKVIILFFLVYGLIIAKDIKLFLYILSQDNLQGLYMQQHNLISDTYKDFIHYKQNYSLVLSHGVLDRNSSFLDLNPGVLATSLFQSYSPLDYDFKDFYKDMNNMKLCEFLDSNVAKCKYFDQVYCNKTTVEVDLRTTFAFDGIWGLCQSGDSEEGVISYLLKMNNFLKNQMYLLDSYYKIPNITERNQLILHSFKDNFEFLTYENINHLLIIIRKWYYVSYQANLAEALTQSTLNEKLLILFLVLVWLLMIFGWWREYYKLRSDSKWVNGFIILLPLHLIKENQHLKVFLKRKIKITNLDN